MSQRLIILFLAIVVVISILVINKTNKSTVQGTSANNTAGSLTITPDFAKLEDVSMKKGLQKTSFSINNNGSEDVTLTDLETSCMCTTAIFKSSDGKTSPSFGMPGHGVKPRGWSYTLKPNEAGELVVEFDPNAHGPNALGPVTRYINIFTSKGTQSVGFSANVIR